MSSNMLCFERNLAACKYFVIFYENVIAIKNNNIGHEKGIRAKIDNLQDYHSKPIQFEFAGQLRLLTQIFDTPQIRIITVGRFTMTELKFLSKKSEKNRNCKIIEGRISNVIDSHYFADE